MSNITVCCRFRPLSTKERRRDNGGVCVRRIDPETFVFKDEKEEEVTFSFDKVFYEDSAQADVYEFLALPIVRDAVNGINGTIITYGQTGAGKTYSLEGPSILEPTESKKGLLPRVLNGLFECIKSVEESIKDLLDLSKDNVQIKDSKLQGILLSGVTGILVSNLEEALQSISTGIVNRTVGETRILFAHCFMFKIEMNEASSRSHSIYILIIQQELTKDKRAKMGKVVLVDLAGSENVEKTGAEGKVLEEAKTINKSLSALGNVIYALTCTTAKASHVPYRDSKLTRILQDALGGSSRTALLCCCSPSPSNALETLSTLRFGTRAKRIKASPLLNRGEDKHARRQETAALNKDEASERILNKLRKRLDAEDVQLLEELFMLEGILFDPYSVEDLTTSAYEDITLKTISSLQQTVEELVFTVNELRSENKDLKAIVAAAERSDGIYNDIGENATFLQKISDTFSFFISWLGPFSNLKFLK